QNSIPPRLLKRDLLSRGHRLKVWRSISGKAGGLFFFAGTSTTVALFRRAFCRGRIGRYADGLATAVITHHIRLQDHVIFHASVRPDSEPLQYAVIRLDRLLRADFPVGDEPEKLNEGELVFGIVDLAAEERHTRAVFPRLAKKLKRVIGRARAAAQDADDEMRIVVNEFLHRLGAVIHHLEKQRPAP